MAIARESAFFGIADLFLTDFTRERRPVRRRDGRNSLAIGAYRTNLVG